MANIDDDVAGFGEEWSRYDQSGVSRQELKRVFDAYFSIFLWESLTENAIGFDLGCGTGRWTGFVAPHVGVLHCVDPSPKALDVAKKICKNSQIADTIWLRSMKSRSLIHPIAQSFSSKLLDSACPIKLDY